MTQTFQNFGLPPKLLEALTHMRFETPTPIQNATIPVALEGHDILGSAQTGTGKTGAFAIPIIAKLMEMPDKAALIMTPTRELGSQVLATIKEMIKVPNLKTALLIGGEPMVKQLSQLKQRPRIIVGTPGRINDHLDRGTLRLNQVAFLVLDETDRMLDLGFDVQIESIISQIPEEHQTLMFSATIAPNIVRLSSQYLDNPKRISVGSTTQAAPNIQQEVIKTTSNQKHGHVLSQLEQNEGSTIIFVKTKRDTERLADRLKDNGYNSEAIHGDLKQSKRDSVIRSFRARRFDILVATDVAARGLDVPHIELVINYDLPQVAEDYIHRIGRTARAGASGKAVNLITSEDGGKWRAISRLMDPKAKSDRHEESFQSGPRRPRKPVQKDDWKQSWKSSSENRSSGPRESSRFGRSDNASGDRDRRGSFNDRGSDRPRFGKPRDGFGRSDNAVGDRDRRGSFNDRGSDRPRFGKPRDGFGRSDNAVGDRDRRGSFNDRGSDRPRFGKPREDFGRSDSASAYAGERSRSSESSFRKREGSHGGDRPFESREKRPFARDSKPFGGGARPFKKSFGDAPRGKSFEDAGARRGNPARSGSGNNENWLDSIFVEERNSAPKSSRARESFSGSAVSDRGASKVERDTPKKTKTQKKPKKKINQLNFAA